MTRLSIKTKVTSLELTCYNIEYATCAVQVLSMASVSGVGQLDRTKCNSFSWLAVYRLTVVLPPIRITHLWVSGGRTYGGMT